VRALFAENEVRFAVLFVFGIVHFERHVYNSRCIVATDMCYCLSAACQQWTSQLNTNYGRGQGSPATSIQACQAACVANAACNGFDWVIAGSLGGQCWLSGPWSGTRGSPAGTTHYVLDRNCPSKLQHSIHIITL